MKIIKPIILLLFLTYSAVSYADQSGAETATRLSLEINMGKMLRLDQPADSIFVANPAVVDVQIQSSRLVHVFAKAFGETNIFVVGKNGEIILSRDVVVEYNTAMLIDNIHNIMPDADIEISTLRGSLIITGTVTSAESAADIASLAARVTGDPKLVESHLRVVSPGQVNLRVRIAEVGRDVSKQLGFSWNLADTVGNMAIGVASGGFAGGAGAIASNLISGAGTIGGTDVNVIIDALDERDLITVLAEPNLTALSGETASFLAGGEYPIPVGFDDNTIGIEFKQYGVGLTFLPVILDGGRIHVKVTTEVSQITDVGAVVINGFNIPALTTRQADTTVNLGSGQSFAIAGLLQEDTDQGADKYPGLGDIPILGALFKSTRFTRSETELVIIVTPYLVRPVSTQMALPTDGFTPASDRNRMLSGDLHTKQMADGNTGLVDGTGRVGPVGPVGFILR